MAGFAGNPVPKGTTLEDFIGQRSIVADVRAKISTSRQRGRLLPHLLLCAPKGMGKLALARAIATTVTRNAVETTGAAVDHKGALAGVLTKLGENDVLVVDEVGDVPPIVAEALVPAVSEHRIDVMTGEGTFASALHIPLQPFTLIATSSRPSQVDRQLRSWFVRYDLGSYTVEELALILERDSKGASREALEELARHSDGSIGDARVLVQRVRKWLPAHAPLDLATTRSALAELRISRPEGSSDDGSRLEDMTGEEFEEYVARLYRGLGYTVETTARSGDHGIDLLLSKAGETAGVQCKRWKGAVGEPVVRDFLGSIAGARLSRGIIVTTGAFTSRACAFAEREKIELIDGDALLALAQQSQFSASLRGVP